MILQNLTLTQTADKRELYVRSEKPCSKFPLELGMGGSVSFATYYNFFSLSKWRKYTSVGELRVVLKCRGAFKIAVDHHLLAGGFEKVDTLLSFESDGDVDVVLPSLPDTGLLSVSLTSLSECSTLFGGGFCSCGDAPNNVRIGIDVCTYRRESAVEEKIGTLDSFLRSCDNGFADSVEMFYIDNGRTLPENLGSDTHSLKVHIIPSKNLGGSGGFTRGMMEIVNSGRFTHVLPNDDDASFDPESIYRTWSFLSFIKEEYKDAHIGGAMLMAESPSIVHESGAVYSGRIGKTLNALKNGLDVSDPVDCLRFDAEEDMNYFAWWYVAVPVSYVKDLGYPLPLFIKWDDVEYSIRGSPTMITLNGVSVWHASIRGKHLISNHYNYYYARNCLITGFTTDNLNRRNVVWAFSGAMFEVITYGYENAELMFKGAEDFLKGPDFVFNLDPDKLMKPLPVKIGKLDELRKEGNFECPEEKKIRLLSLNGLLLPRERDVEITSENVDSASFYRVGKVLYNMGNGEGFIAERNAGKALRAMLRGVFLMVKTVFSFGRLRNEYKRSLEKYSSEENWKKIFEL